MALTIEIDGLGVIANADATTNDTGGDGTGDWGFTGSGGVANGLTTDTYKYGTASISAALSGTKNGWLWFNTGTGTGYPLDFSSGGNEENQHIYIWVACPTLGLTATLANEGLTIRIGSSTTDFNDYTIGGTDGSNGWDGAWKCFIIDPTKTASNTGGTINLASIQYIGARMSTTATAKGDNLFISQIAVGYGLKITGTSTTGWKEVVDYCIDYPNRAWGMFQEREGVYYAYGRITIGDVGVSGTHTAGTSTTVMTDSTATFSLNEFVGHTIYNTTDASSGTVTANDNTTITVASLTGGTNNDWRTNDAYTVTNQNANVSFTDSGRTIQFGVSEYYVSAAWSTSADLDYSAIVVEDTSSYTTTFTDGVIVGSDKGRSGSQINGNANHDVALDLYGGNNTGSLTALYGTTLKNLTGVLNSGNDSDHKFLSVSWIGCEQFNPVGAPVIRNNIFAETASVDGSLLWNSNIDIQASAFIANTTGEAIEHDTWNGLASGTASNTGSETTTLFDTGTNFDPDVSVNDIVYNETDGSYATVTAIVSDTEVTHTALANGTNNFWTTSDVYSFSTPISYTDLTFSGNTTDVNNTSSPNNVLAISKAGTSDPVTSAGFVVIQGSVTVQITVKDTSGAAISGVQTGVYLTSDRTEILNDSTNGSGIASTTYAGSTPVEVEVRCRKASSADNPRYVNFSSIQNIQSGTGLSLDVTLQEDNNNNATT